MHDAETVTENAGSNAVRPGRRPYETPRLTSLGVLHGLTSAAGTIGNDDISGLSSPSL
jgi:hypothetical protein